MKKARYTDAAKALKCIAHPDRLAILNLLGCKKRCAVYDIQRSVGLTQSMTSQHLLAMKAHGVLASEKVKNSVFYFINNKNVLSVIKCMKDCKKNR